MERVTRITRKVSHLPDHSQTAPHPNCLESCLLMLQPRVGHHPPGSIIPSEFTTDEVAASRSALSPPSCRVKPNLRLSADLGAPAAPRPRSVPSPLRGASRGCLFKIGYSSHPPHHYHPPKFRKDHRLSRRTEQTSFQSGKGRRRRKQEKDGEGVALDSRESPLWLPTGSSCQRPRNLLPASSDRRVAQTRASHHPGFVRPSAPWRTSSAEGP